MKKHESHETPGVTGDDAGLCRHGRRCNLVRTRREGRCAHPCGWSHSRWNLRHTAQRCGHGARVIGDATWHNWRRPHGSAWCTWHRTMGCHVATSLWSRWWDPVEQASGDVLGRIVVSTWTHTHALRSMRRSTEAEDAGRRQHQKQKATVFELRTVHLRRGRGPFS